MTDTTAPASASPAAKTGDDPFRALGGPLIRDIWYVAMTSDELKAGKLHKKKFLGEPIVMGRDGKGAPFALRDLCPHRAVPLSAGQMLDEPDGGKTVECPYHG